jgi:DNA repair protein RadC
MSLELPRPSSGHRYCKSADLGFAVFRMVRETYRTDPSLMQHKMNCPNDVLMAMQRIGMEAWDQEVFGLLLLDAKDGIIANGFLEIFRGTLNSSLVSPRDVFRPAIIQGAASMILIHNHPSGDPTPSPEDIHVTRQFVRLGELHDIPIQDHVIIGHGRHYSFSEAGLLSSMRH